MSQARQSKPANHSAFQMVNVADLCIDPAAQRKLSRPWVKARVPEFDVDQLGYIVVNKRTNGKLFVVDGQHRVELMRAVGWGDQQIHAEMFVGLSLPDEAALFIARQLRRTVTKFDKFRISVTAEDPVACHIDRIVKQAGLVVSDQSRDGHICAVDALERVYLGGGIASAQEGPAALSKALKILVRAWGQQSSSVNGKVIQALGLVFLRYNGSVDEPDLTKKLAPFPGGAPGLLGKGRSQQELSGRPLHHCIAAIIVDQYNKGRRTAKLEAWES